MAATVLNGTGNPTWTNTTGGIVRVIINYFGSANVVNPNEGYGISLGIDSAFLTAGYAAAIGKNLALNNGGGASNGVSSWGNAVNMVVLEGGVSELYQQALPIEFYLAPSKTFSLTLSGGTAQYNIIIIPEAG